MNREIPACACSPCGGRDALGTFPGPLSFSQGFLHESSETGLTLDEAARGCSLAGIGFE